MSEAGDVLKRRSIPAQAGEPSRSPCWRLSLAVYPRAGGGTRATNAALNAKTGLSPRRRGNLFVSGDAKQLNRSIPAQAGEPIRPG